MFNQGRTFFFTSFASKSTVMKPTILFTLFLVFAGSLFSLQAQDRIIKRDGDIIDCKVLEIGSKEVKYSLAEYDHQVQFSIEKISIEKILFENGQELVIDHAAEAMKSAENNSADLFLVQNRNAIKISFIGPLMGSTALTYERAIKPGQSLELSLGLIGLAFSNENNAAGIGFSGGYKFIRSPDFYLEGMRYAHILKGAYVRPEFSIATYEARNNSISVTKAAVMITLGKQWVYSDVFLIDLYAGFGYGVTSHSSLDHWPYMFAVGKNTPIAGNAGFRIGFLF
jgi:hypothetical protein